MPTSKLSTSMEDLEASASEFAKMNSHIEALKTALKDRRATAAQVVATEKRIEKNAEAVRYYTQKARRDLAEGPGPTYVKAKDINLSDVPTPKQPEKANTRPKSKSDHEPRRGNEVRYTRQFAHVGSARDAAYLRNETRLGVSPQPETPQPEAKSEANKGKETASAEPAKPRIVLSADGTDDVDRRLYEIDYAVTQHLWENGLRDVALTIIEEAGRKGAARVLDPAALADSAKGPRGVPGWERLREVVRIVPREEEPGKERANKDNDSDNDSSNSWSEDESVGSSQGEGGDSDLDAMRDVSASAPSTLTRVPSSDERVERAWSDVERVNSLYARMMTLLRRRALTPAAARAMGVRRPTFEYAQRHGFGLVVYEALTRKDTAGAMALLQDPGLSRVESALIVSELVKDMLTGTQAQMEEKHWRWRQGLIEEVVREVGADENPGVASDLENLVRAGAAMIALNPKRIGHVVWDRPGEGVALASDDAQLFHPVLLCPVTQAQIWQNVMRLPCGHVFSTEAYDQIVGDRSITSLPCAYCGKPITEPVKRTTLSLVGSRAELFVRGKK